MGTGARKKERLQSHFKVEKNANDGRSYLANIHVSGKRMIAQGTEGGSRGDLNQGVIIGESM